MIPIKLDIRWREGDHQRIKNLFMEIQAMRRLRGRDGLFARFLKVLPKFIKKNFDSEGARLGAPWAPLSPDYEQAKELRYPGNQILVASGHMRLAATIPNAPGNWIQWSGNVMTYGIDTSKFRGGYPASHQHGAMIPSREIHAQKAKALHFWYKGKEVFCKSARPGPGTIPMRPFMALAPEDLEELVEITANYMMEQIPENE